MKQLKTALNSLFTPEAAPRSTKAPTQEYVATYFDASGNRLLTHTGMPKYARQSLTVAAHHRIMAADAKHLIGVFRAELTLRTFPDCKEVHTIHFAYRNGEFLHLDAKPEVPATKGIDISAVDRDNKAITAVAKKPSSRVAATQKPGKAVVVARADTKLAAKLAKKVKAAKPAPAPVEETHSDWMVWSDDTVIEVLMGTPMTRAQAQKKATLRYSGPVVVTTVAEGHLKDAALKASKKKAPKPVAAKPAKKAATPKGQPSDAMLRELMACHAGKPTQDKLGSCMRMHLKMRGLVSDMKAGTLTADGQKLAKSHVSGKVQKQPK